ncbi:DNA-binding protein [Virgibacillus sp. CBA3643]|uniref:DNA-binding protein n=1 Tax=Virgibacillus sp. CBA3643 TaxID=2942278 RepID=UPI0035A37296
MAAAAYFIGDGLKSFKNPDAKNITETFGEKTSDFLGEPQLIKENEIHHYTGISKEDAKSLIQEYPDVPHIIINNRVYYPIAKLREWLKNIGE